MRLILAFLIACGCALAQWSGVTGLEADRAVSIERAKGGIVRGRFVRASADEVTVREGKKETTVAKAEVVKVSARREGHARWWGLGIGAGGGAAMGSALGTRLDNEGRNLMGASVAVVGALGALIGYAVGEVFDSRGIVVYRAP